MECLDTVDDLTDWDDKSRRTTTKSDYVMKIDRSRVDRETPSHSPRKAIRRGRPDKGVQQKLKQHTSLNATINNVLHKINEYCLFHKSIGHATIGCQMLRDYIEELLDQGDC